MRILYPTNLSFGNEGNIINSYTDKKLRDYMPIRHVLQERLKRVLLTECKKY